MRVLRYAGAGAHSALKRLACPPSQLRLKWSASILSQLRLPWSAWILSQLRISMRCINCFCLVAFAFTALVHAAEPPQLKTASTHPIQYYLSLPEGWVAGKKWPVVVVIESAEREFLQAATAFAEARDRKSTRLNSSHLGISYAVFCLKNK